METTSTPQRPEDFLRLDLQKPPGFKDVRTSLSLSIAIHALVVVAMLVPWAWHWGSDETVDTSIKIRWHVPGGDGPGGGGGGGGSGGSKPTTYIIARSETPDTTPIERQAPIAPRRIPPLRADRLTVSNLPSDAFLDQPLSPDAVDLPGLSLTDTAVSGGVEPVKSAGSGGGLGGGEGIGVGPGSGWGVGPGRGGGFGGGDYSPGAWDVEPILRYKHPADYPPRARERLVRGEVILEILVHTDGSTEVLRVIKSLPEGCVDAAIGAARLYRWKPALKKGKPVQAIGIVTITFNLLNRKG